MNELPVGDAHGVQAKIFDSKIILFHTGDKGVYVYDEAADSWTRKAGNLPDAFKKHTRVELVDSSVLSC